MREITIGKKQVRVRATPLALLYYQQEFDSDLVGDIVKMKGAEKDPSKFDSVVCLRITWAMAKADTGINNSFPDFLTWLSELDSFDLSNPELLKAVMEEAADGFFRRGVQKKQGNRK
ncbi:MAG: hypothetical protein ACOY46_19850 [Bacillota bacterium]